MAGKSNGKGKGLKIGTLTEIVEKPVTGGDEDNVIDQSSSGAANRINGGDGNDSIVGTGFADRVNAGDGDDTVMGGAGDDVLFGNDGTDTAAYEGSIFNYLWEDGKGNSLTVTDTTGADGIDTLKHFEYLQFEDYTFDLNGPNAALILVDDPSTLEDDPQLTDEDTGHSFGIQAWDFDGGSPALVSIDVTGGGTVDAVATGALAQGMGTGTSFDVSYDPNGAYEYLAVGESTTETITVVMDDGQGNLSTKLITLTIEGVNDAPEIDAGASVLSGGVSEHADLSAEENVTSHNASGQVSFSDVDVSDTHTSSFVANGTGYRGTFSVDAPTTTSATTDGQIGWSFDIADADIDDLREGQVLTQSYDITVDDGNGGTDSTTVTVTITGTNDAPIIESAAVVVDFVESVAPSDYTASGVITFSDVDTLDSHVVTRGPLNVTGEYLGQPMPYGDEGIRADDIAMLESALVVNPDGTWSFDMVGQGDRVERLSEGMSFTLTSLITVTDDSGAANNSDTQLLTITITGTNDAPEVLSSVSSGGVTEIADNAAGENSDTLSTAGTIEFRDVDQANLHTVSVTPVDGGYRGAMSAAVTAETVGYGNQNNGVVDWQFDIADADIDDLAAGQVLTQSYVLTITDNDGGSTSETVTVTITGTNDAPVIAQAESVLSGAVTEHADLSADENATSHNASGQVSFADVDTLDTHTASASANGVGYRGSFTIAQPTTTNATTDGQVAWSFDIADADIDDLAAGQTLTQSYTVTVTDNNGASDSEVVTVTVTGTNDAPVIGVADDSGSVQAEVIEPGAAVGTGEMTFHVEQYQGYSTNNLTTMQNIMADPAAFGVTLYEDNVPSIDYRDYPVAGYASVNNPWPAAAATGETGYQGVNDYFFSRITTDFDVTSAGNYSFRTYNDDGVYLFIDGNLVINDPGYHGSQTYTGTVNLSAGQHNLELFFFEHGGAAVLELLVADSSGNFQLMGQGAAGLTGAGGSVELTDSGSIAFTDVDLTDTHTVSVTADGTGYHGDLTAALADASTGDGSGSVDWNFAVDNADLEYLGAGEVVTQTYTVTVTDNIGTSDSQQVTITLTGTNEAPVIGVADTAGSITEIADNAAGENSTTHVTDGSIAFSDVDLIDTHTVSVAENGTGYRGTMTAVVADASTGDGAGSVDWSFSVDDSAIDDLAAGQTLTQSYTITIDDGEGGTDTEMVTVTITGANDAPVIGAADLAGSVTEIADLAAGENSTTHIADGSIAFTDVDLTDGHTVTVSANGAGYRGNMSAVVADASTGDGAGGVDWTFQIDDSAIDDLAAGQTLVQSYNVTVDDGQGGSDTETVTVTITGTNDAPVFEATDAESVVFADTIESTSGIQFTGGFQWSSTNNTGPFGYTSVGSELHTNNSSTAWSGLAYLPFNGVDAPGTYTVYVDIGNYNNAPYANVANIGLRAGGTFLTPVESTTPIPSGGTKETWALTYEVTQADINAGIDFGLYVPTTGQNYNTSIDNLIITQTIEPNQGAVTEVADNAAGENATTHVADGSIAFGDVDLIDSHTVIVSADGAGYRGSMTAVVADASTGDGAGSVDWTFQIDDSAIDDLAAGQTLTQSYTITIDDGQGGTDTETVIVTVTGTNDAPVIDAAASDLEGSVADGMTLSGELEGHGLLANYVNTVRAAYVDASDVLNVGSGDHRKALVELPLVAAGTFTEGDTVTVNLSGSVLRTSGDYDMFFGLQDGDGHISYFNVDGSAGGLFADSISATGVLGVAYPENPPVNDRTGLGHLPQVEDFDLRIVVDGNNDQITLVSGNGTIFNVSGDAGDFLNANNELSLVIAGDQSWESYKIVDMSYSLEQAGTLVDQGTIVFDDVDVTDTHTVAITGVAMTGDAGGLDAAAVEAMLALNVNGHTVDWTFTGDKPSFVHLGAGETFEIAYTITIDDANGGQDTEVLTISVAGANDGPVASLIIGATNEDAGLAIFDLLATASDIDGDDLDTGSVAITSSDGRTVVFSVDNATGELSIDTNQFTDLAVGEALELNVTYQVVDGNGGFTPNLATLSVTGANDAPTVSAIVAANSNEDAAPVEIDLLLTAADVDVSDDLDVANVLVSSSDGRSLSFTVDTETGAFSIDPGQYNDLAVGESETVTVNYDVVDGNGGVAANTASVVIEGRNDAVSVDTQFDGEALHLENNGYLAIEGGTELRPESWTVEAWIRTEDDDGQYNRIITAPVGGGQTYSLLVRDGEAHVRFDNGVTSYKHVQAVEVADGAWHHLAGTYDADSNILSLFVDGSLAGTLDAGPYPPITGGEDVYIGLFSAGYSQSLNGDIADVRVWSEAKSGADIAADMNGPITDPDGEDSLVLYMPLNGDASNHANFDVTNHGVISYVGSDAAVEAAHVSEDGIVSTSGVIEASDPDASDVLTFSVASNGTKGSASIDPASGEWTYNLDNASSDIQSLAAGETTTDTFFVEVSDGNGSTETVNVTVSITGTNDAPVAVADTAAATAGESFSGVVYSEDFEGGASGWTNNATTTIAGLTQFLGKFGGGASTANTIALNGTPDSVTISFDVYEMDSWDGEAFQVWVEGAQLVNDTMSIDQYYYNDGSSKPFAVSVTNTAPTGGTGWPTEIWHYEITMSPTDSNLDLVFGSSLDQGAADESWGLDNLVITQNGGGGVSGNVGDNDSDVDNGAVLTYSLNAPVDGLTFNSDGSWSFDGSHASYIPLGAGETQDVVVNYTVTDEHGATDTATLTITVTGVNEGPTANDDTNSGELVEQGFWVAGNAQATGNVLGNDTDPDTTDVLSVNDVNGTTVTAAGVVIAGTYGSLTIAADGSWTYNLDNADPDTDALEDGDVVQEVFTYTMEDGNGGSESATLTLSIEGSADNEPPVVTDDSFSVDEDVATVLDLTANDTDANGDAVSVASINGQAVSAGDVVDTDHGKVTVNGDGTVTYQGDEHYSGADSFTYTGTDGSEESLNTATVSVDVEAVADAPLVEFAQAPVTGDVSFVTGDILVGDPNFGQWYGSLAPLADGGFVASYTSVLQDSSSGGIYVQRFDASGNAVGSEIQANTYTYHNQSYSDVTTFADGSFVVVWGNYTRSGWDTSDSIQAQMFAADGTKVGSDFLVNTTTSGKQERPEVTTLNDDSFVVTWMSEYMDTGNTGNPGYAVAMQRYASDGTPIGGETKVNTYIDNHQDRPSIASLSDGGFVIAWESNGQDGSGEGIYAQRFDANSNPVGSEFHVSTTTSSNQSYPHVDGLAGGGFVVAWAGSGANAQIFDANGNPVGGEFQASANASSYPTVAGLDDGGFLITSNSWGAVGGDGMDLVGQRYDATGTPVGDEFVINSGLVGNQGTIGAGSGSTTIQLADGNIVSTWRSNTNNSEVFVRVMDIGGGDTGGSLEDEPMPIDLSASLVDTDGSETLSLELSGFPAGATFNLGAAEGNNWVIPQAESVDLSTLTMTPPANWNGDFTLSVVGTATDENGDTASTTATADFTITPVNDAPTSSDEVTFGDEDTVITGSVTGVDIDGDALTFDLVSGASNGTVTLNANGSYSYQPNLNFNGTDSFTFVANDGDLTSAVQTVTITVNPVNDAPVADALQVSGDEDTVINGNVTGSDVDGDDLTYSVVSGPANGSVSMNDDGTFSYTPDANYNGGDSFTFVANDGELDSVEQVVAINVNAVNDAPTLYLPGMKLAYATESAAYSSGLPVYSENNSGALSGEVISTVTYRMEIETDAGNLQWAEATFDAWSGLTIEDLALPTTSNGNVLQIDVTGLSVDSNVAGVVTGDGLDGRLEIWPYNYLTNNTLGGGSNSIYDTDDSPTYSASYGSFQIHNMTDLQTVFAWNNHNEYPGYSIDIGFGNQSGGHPDWTFAGSPGLNESTFKLQVFVESSNGVTSVSEDGTFSINLAAYGDDIDADDDGSTLTYTVSGAPSSGTASVNGTTLNFDPGSDFQYLDDDETATVEIEVTATDGHGASATDTIKLTVTGSNDAPTSSDEAVSGDEDTVINGSVAGSDVDGDALTFDLVSGASNGTVTLNANGSYSYQPNLNFNGTDSFTFVANDGDLISAVQTVTITVNPVNDAPVADASAVSGDEDTVINGTVTASDIEGDNLTFTVATQGANGTVAMAADGTFTYTPDEHFSGSDSFTYLVDDGNGGTDTETVSVTVTPVADAPLAALGGGTKTPEAISGDIVVDQNSYQQRFISGTALNDGKFVAVWGSYNEDGSNWGTYYQVFNEDGTAYSSAMRANVTTYHHQLYSSATELDNGGFAITWGSYAQDGSNWGIYTRQFASDGTPTTGEVLVNSTTYHHQYLPEIETLSDGSYVISWQSYTQDGSSYGVYSQRFAANGNKLGGETQIHTDTVNSQEYVDISAGENGGYIAVWGSSSGDNSGWGVKGQMFDANGAKVGSEFLVNTYTSSTQYVPDSAGLADGSYVVTWDSYAADNSAYAVRGQRFDANGNKIGSEFQANTFTAYDQVRSNVLALDDGGFLVSWRSTYQDNATTHGIFAQRYDSDGNKVGTEFQINADSNGNQTIESHTIGDQVIQLQNGNLVAFWDQDYQDLEMRIFEVGTTFEGDEETPVALDLSAIELVDTDGSETLELTLSGHPTGSVYNVGYADGANWVIENAQNVDLSTLTVTTPVDWFGNFKLDVIAVATETASGATATSTGTASVNVDNVNDHAPVAASDVAVTSELLSTLIDVLGNDTDADTFDSLSITSASVVSGGGSVRILNGMLEYDPEGDYDTLNAGQVANVQLSYTISDGEGGSDTGSVTVSVEGVNTPGINNYVTLTTGNDNWYGQGGNQLVETHEGNDTVYGDFSSWYRYYYYYNDSFGSDVIHAGEGGDTVYGDGEYWRSYHNYNGNHYLNGGHDFLMGDEGNDRMVGDINRTYIEYARNVVRYQGGQDEMHGEAGNDVMYGDNDYIRVNYTWGSDVDMIGGVDEMYGGSGNDTMAGDFWNAQFNSSYGYQWYGWNYVDFTGANDYMDGGTGDDQMIGDMYYVRDYQSPVENPVFRGGADQMLGGDGNDTIFGDFTNIYIAGWSYVIGGADTIEGGAGDDNLYGDRGNYTSGSYGFTAGADVFVFNPNSGADRIHDFQDGVDKLDVSGYGFTSASQMTIGTNNGQTYVDFGGGNYVYLQSIFTITDDDFIF